MALPIVSVLDWWRNLTLNVVQLMSEGSLISPPRDKAKQVVVLAQRTNPCLLSDVQSQARHWNKEPQEPLTWEIKVKNTKRAVEKMGVKLCGVERSPDSGHRRNCVVQATIRVFCACMAPHIRPVALVVILMSGDMHCLWFYGITPQTILLCVGCLACVCAASDIGPHVYGGLESAQTQTGGKMPHWEDS